MLYTKRSVWINSVKSKIYLGDITIHSRTVDEHFEHLEIVFKDLET